MNAVLMLNCDSFFTAERKKHIQNHGNINKLLQNRSLNRLQIAQAAENHAQRR